MGKINRFTNLTPQQYVSQYVPAPIELFQNKLNTLQKRHDLVKGKLEEYESKLLEKKAAPYHDTEVLKRKTEEYNTLFDEAYNTFLGGPQGKRKAVELVKKLKYDEDLKKIEQGYNTYKKWLKNKEDLYKKGKYNFVNEIDHTLKFNRYKTGNDTYFTDIMSEEDANILPDIDVYKNFEKYVNDLKENKGLAKLLGKDPNTGKYVYQTVSGVSSERVKNILRTAAGEVMRSPAGEQIKNEAKYKALQEGKLEEYLTNPQVQEQYVNDVVTNYISAAVQEHSNMKIDTKFVAPTESKERFDRAKRAFQVGQPATAAVSLIGEDNNALAQKVKQGDVVAKDALNRINHQVEKELGITEEEKNKAQQKAFELNGIYNRYKNEVKPEEELTEEEKSELRKFAIDNEYTSDVYSAGFYGTSVTIGISYEDAQILKKMKESGELSDEELKKYFPKNLSPQFGVYSRTTTLPFIDEKFSYDNIEEKINEKIESGSFEVGTSIPLVDTKKVNKVKQIIVSSDASQLFDFDKAMGISSPEELQAKNSSIQGAAYIKATASEPAKLKLTLIEGSGDDKKVRDVILPLKAGAIMSSGYGVDAYLLSSSLDLNIEDAEKLTNENRLRTTLPVVVEGSNKELMDGNLIYNYTQGSNDTKRFFVSHLPPTVLKKIQEGEDFQYSLISPSETTGKAKIKYNGQIITNNDAAISIYRAALKQVNPDNKKINSNLKKQISDLYLQNVSKYIRVPKDFKGNPVDFYTSLITNHGEYINKPLEIDYTRGDLDYSSFLNLYSLLSLYKNNITYQ